jgi:hypothetical protein
MNYKCNSKKPYYDMELERICKIEGWHDYIYYIREYGIMSRQTVFLKTVIMDVQLCGAHLNDSLQWRIS